MFLCSGCIIFISSSPTSKMRVFGRAQSIFYQVKKRWGITFHQESSFRIFCPQGTLASDMLIQPRIVYYAEIRPRKPSMEIISADSGPGCKMIGIIVMGSRACDVKEGGECLSKPGS